MIGKTDETEEIVHLYMFRGFKEKKLIIAKNNQAPKLECQ